MFTIKFYKNSAEKNRLNKIDYLTDEVSLSGSLRGGTSIISPSFEIEYDSVPDFNYCYIQSFNRYYFVVNIISQANNLWLIQLSVDVLMSFKNKISQLDVILNRTADANYYNPEIADNKLPTEYKTVITKTNYPNINEFFDTAGFDDIYVINVTSNESDILGDHALYVRVYDTIKIPNREYSVIQSYNNIIFTNQIGIYYLSKLIFSDDSLASFIKNIIIFPLKLIPNPYMMFREGTISVDLYDPDIQSDYGFIRYVDGIKLGNSFHQFTIEQSIHSDMYSIKPQYDNIFHIATVKPTRQYNNFLDFEPYTKLSLILPYYGEVDLNTVEVYDKDIGIYYVLNYTNGHAMIFICNDTDKIVLDSYDCQLGIQVALNASNALQVAANHEYYKNTLVNSEIRAAGDAVNSIGGGLGQMFGGNLIGGIGRVVGGTAKAGANAAQAGADYTYNEKMNRPKATSVGTTDGNEAWYGESEVILVRQTYEYIVPDNYDSLIGRPSNKKATIGNVDGFLTVSSVHVENIPTATDDELSEIEQLLYSGIINEVDES